MYKFVFLAKKIWELLIDNHSLSMIIAAVLAFFSLIIIHAANRKSALNSQEELTKTMEETAEITLDRINEATITMVSKSEEASEKITQTIDILNTQLNGQLNLIDSATKNLKNQMENQEILLEIDYSFDWKFPNFDKYEPISYTSSMINQLSENNYYQLKIISKEGKESFFATDINSFRYIDDTRNDEEIIENTFAPVIILNEHAKYNHSFKMKFPIKAVSIRFLLEQISPGDIIEFVLTKNAAKKPSSKKDIISGFNLFTFTGHPEENPTGKIKLGIKLRNGKAYTSKTTLCTITGTNSESFRCSAQIQ